MINVRNFEITITQHFQSLHHAVMFDTVSLYEFHGWEIKVVIRLGGCSLSVTLLMLTLTYKDNILKFRTVLHNKFTVSLVQVLV